MEKRKKSKGKSCLTISSVSAPILSYSYFVSVVCKLIDSDMDTGTGSWSDDSPPGEFSCLYPPQNDFQHEAKISFKFPPPPIVSGNHGHRHANVYEQLESDSSHCYTTGSMSDVEDNSDSQSEGGKGPEHRRLARRNISYIPVSGMNHLSDLVYAHFIDSCRSLQEQSSILLTVFFLFAGSHSDTGFSNLRSKSSPISIHRPRCVRGYDSDGSPINMRTAPRLLPPIGVFWDIENCQVSQEFRP